MGILYLIISITCSSLINIIFKSFKINGVNKLVAVIMNYLVCFVVGYSLAGGGDLIQVVSSEWFIYPALLGVLFVGIFFSMAMTTDKLGASVTAVSSKMNVVLTVLFLILYANEKVSLIYVIGLILSLASIYYVSVKEANPMAKKYFYLPVIVFFGSGLIDISIKQLETKFAATVELNTLTYSIFLGAFLAGIIIYLVGYALKQTNPIKSKDIIGGIILGIPNYFSIYFLISAISYFTGQSALVYGVNNIAIVLFTTLMAVVFYKEEINRKNKLGLLLAVISIVLLSYAYG